VEYGDTLSVDPPVAAPAVTSRLSTLLRRLDDASDRVSPMVVKEVRQIVRGREFNYSFMVSLIVGLLVAFFGAANASAAGGTTGQSVFTALTACLTLLGMVVVPFGAFSALRNERLEQTMDLITVTSLSTRKVIVGKLLAQGVKLSTLFAGMAPFIATSFLLGGIDFVSIIVTLAVVFLASLWVCAAALVVSSASKARSIAAGLLAAGPLLFILFVGGTQILPLVLFGLTGSGGRAFRTGLGVSIVNEGWWAIGMLMTVGAISIVNLVLLAENRLSSPVENKATGLRIGFLVQFLAIIVLIAAAAYFNPTVTRASEPIAVLCLLQLFIVAAFTVTEAFPVSRRVQIQMQTTWWRFTRVIFGPGGGRGAAYVLLQMAVLLVVVWQMKTRPADFNWVLAACGYVCFFTGVPAVALRVVRPRMSSFRLRVAILVLFSASLVLPDVVYYLLAPADGFSLAFGTRHLLNPLRALANWHLVEGTGLLLIPQILGTVGLAAYATLVLMNLRQARASQGA
jgi:hypothetical protein